MTLQGDHLNSVSDEDKEGRKRLKVFGTHMAGYFVVMIIIVPLNMIYSPERPWFFFPMIGWGSVLALHAAYVMGLVEIFRKDNE